MSQATQKTASGPAPAGDRRPGLRVDLDNIEMSFTTTAGGTKKTLRVLDGVSTTIEAGQFCCVVGPSGCGKSTLLRIIHGLEKPAGGQARINGVPVTGPSDDIGFVFQQFNLLPWRSVRANVEFGMENRGVPKDKRRERARHWLKLVDLEGFEDHYPAQLSGGMQQRVGLARALAVEPQILLMDEPFGSLDDQTKMLLQAELLQIWEQDYKTVVFITHDIEEALFLGDVVHIMGPRPSNIIHTIEVPFERPRSDAVRADPTFARLKETIWEELKRGIREAGGAR